MRRRRIIAVSIVFGLAFGGIAARAVQLTLFSSSELGAQAMRQALHDLKLSGPRGDVYDRAGAPLAVSTRVPSLFASPRAISDRTRLAERLARTLGQSFDKIFPLLTGDRAFIWVQRWLSPETAKRIRALGERGLGLVAEPRRYYPMREIAAHLLGFVGLDGRGLSGLEGSFDAQLRGHRLTLKSMRDARGRKYLRGGVPPPATAGAGKNLVLTIDRAVQYLAMDALGRAARAHRAKGGAAVVVDPASGEILALASYPTFNPNAIGESDPASRRNRPITDAFEPGSTMKPFTIAVALEHNLLALNERLYCEKGSWRFGPHRITDIKGRGYLVPAEILKFSSNICAAKVGLKVGAVRLREALHRFGFGQRPKTMLPGESAGVLHQAARWKPSHVVTHSYGYGLSMTALQLAMAYAALANGGELLRPRLVRKVKGRDGQVLVSFEREVRNRAITARSARRVTKMLVGVTEGKGTGRRAAIPGFRVAGKTGTAMKIGPDGRYSSAHRTVLFAGFVPAFAPRLVTVVVLDEPAGKAMGGSVAAPVFREISEGALRLWGVPPTEPLEEKKNVASKAAKGTHPAAVSASTQPSTGVKVTRATTRAGRVPDVRGLGVRSAARILAAAGLSVDVSGSGRAKGQSPQPGARAAPGAVVHVRFGREDG